MNKILTIAITVVVLSGCVNRLGDFTVMSTKNMDIKRTLHSVDTGKRLTGDDTVLILLFPWGTPNLEEAIDNAIEKDKRAVGLSDVTLKSFIYGIGFLGIAGFEVEGNAVYENTGRGRR